MPVTDQIVTVEVGPLSSEFYLDSLDQENKDLYTSGTITIPLKNEGEEVVIDAINDLPDDPSELCAVLENEESQVEYWLVVAKAYANQGKVQEALNVISYALDSEVIKNSSSDVRSMLHTFLSWLYLANNGQENDPSLAFNLALEEIRTASTLDNSNECNILADAVLSLVSKKEKTKKQNYEKESRLFDLLLKKNPSNCFALMGKAKIFFYKESYLAALKIFQKILMINPLLKPDSRIGIGLCFWLLGRKDLAYQAWQNSLQLFPAKNIEAKILISMCKFDEAFSNSTSDEEFETKYSEALEFTKASYNESPSNSVVLIILASYYFSRGDYSMVEKLCKKVLESKVLNSSNNVKSDALLWLARCKFTEKDFLSSQKLFGESIKLNENNVSSKIGYGQCQIVRNQIGDAMRTFEKMNESNSKILEVLYILGMLYSKSSKYSKRAIEFLEKYVKLSVEQNEPVNISAFLTLSNLYEDRDMSESLKYLNLAKEQELLFNNDDISKVHYALLNNVGVFALLKNENNNNPQQLFEDALKSLNRSYIDNEEERSALEITLKYNIARCKESTNDENDVKSAMEIYESILEKCPNYSNAKIRWLLLTVLSKNENIKDQMIELLKTCEDDLEVRSFFGWYIRKFGKKHELNVQNKDIESEHHRETLVSYDKHDSYALVSLGNVYCALARDFKVSNPKEQQKKDNYYFRAAQLYQKALSIDSRNVYAAQGIAIILADRKQNGLALEIFRKIRDSLQDISIYLNLGHCLLEVKQFAKSIESYNIALTRFGNNNDYKILVYLGRAWLFRGLSEQNINSLKTALEYSEKAYELQHLSSIKFNTAFIQFQIADFIRKLPLNKRSVKDIEDCLIGLEIAIKTLNQLSEEKYPPYPSDDLKARALMGKNTLTKQLERCINEQKSYDDQFLNKLNEAKKIQEEEQRLEEERKQREEAARIEELERLATERKALEEKAQEWNQLRIEEEKDAKDELDGEADDKGEPRKRKRSSNSKKQGSNKKQKKSKKKFVASDEEDEESDNNSSSSGSGSGSDSNSDSEPEPEPEKGDDNDEEEEAKSTDDEGTTKSKKEKKSKKKSTNRSTKKSSSGRKKKKSAIVDDEEDDDEEDTKSSSIKGKKSQLSKEIIEDSDDEIEGELDDEEARSAQIKKGIDDDDDDDDDE